MSLSTISIIVTGKVQGVVYRQSTKEIATTAGITGTVENREDGSVLIIATGTAEQLDKLIAWCRQGPSRAVVEKIEVLQIPLQHFKNFTIDRK